MAIAAATIFEVRTGGADTNGGGFVAGASGTDHSQQDAAQYAVTDAVTNGTTTITSATASFGTDVVGNILYISGGTGSITAARYQIVSRTNSTTIVVDRSTGLTTGTGATLNIGGALASPGELGKVLNNQSVDGPGGFIRSGTYTITTSTANVSGGPIALGTFEAFLEGYETTRGDLGAMPEINAGAVTGVTLISVGNTGGADPQMAVNLHANGNSQTGVKGIYIAAQGNGNRLKATNCPAGGVEALSMVSNIEVSGNGTYGLNAPGGTSVSAIGNTGASTDGIQISTANNGMLTDFVAHGNGRHGVSAPGTSRRLVISNGTIDGNTGSGFATKNGAAQGTYLVDVILSNNGGYGAEYFASSNASVFIRVASYNNTSGRSNASSDLWNDIDAKLLSADPYVDRGNDDFRLNETAGGGAELRGLSGGIPGQTNNRDIGGTQHADPSGGGVIVIED